MATGTIGDTNYANISANNTVLINTDISAYTSSNPFVAPRDGYIMAQATTSGKGVINLYGASIQLDIPAGYWGDVFIKKGCSCYCASNISRAFFRAFW